VSSVLKSYHAILADPFLVFLALSRKVVVKMLDGLAVLLSSELPDSYVVCMTAARSVLVPRQLIDFRQSGMI